MKKYILFILFTFFTLSGCQNIVDDSDLNDNIEEVIALDSFVPKKIEYLFIHCTATRGSWTKEKLLSFFYNNRGWSRSGYHYYVPNGGLIDTLITLNDNDIIEYNEIANGVKGYNDRSIHIAYDGGVDPYTGTALDTRDEGQKQALSFLIRRLRCQYPDIEVKGHRDVSNKACPSFDASKEYSDLLSI